MKRVGISSARFLQKRRLLFCFVRILQPEGWISLPFTGQYNQIVPKMPAPFIKLEGQLDVKKNAMHCCFFFPAEEVGFQRPPLCMHCKSENHLAALDCPKDASTIHKVGRTARCEEECNALLFLLPCRGSGILEASIVHALQKRESLGSTLHTHWGQSHPTNSTVSSILTSSHARQWAVSIQKCGTCTAPLYQNIFLHH